MNRSVFSIAIVAAVFLSGAFALRAEEPRVDEDSIYARIGRQEAIDAEGAVQKERCPCGQDARRSFQQRQAG